MLNVGHQRLGLSALDQPLDAIVALPVVSLASLEQELIAEGETLEARKTKFEAALSRMFADKAQDAYREAGKDTGTVRIMASNALELKVDVSKKVVWDQPKLRAVLDNMTPDDARHYAKVTIEIPEAKFKNAPPALASELATARAVKTGAMKFTFADTTDGEE